MSSFEVPNTLAASTKTSKKGVDALKLKANFDRTKTEWTAGTNTDFFVDQAKINQLGTSLSGSESMTVGTTNKTTYYGDIENCTGVVDVYEFIVTYPYAADNIRELDIAYSGTIEEISAVFGKTTSPYSSDVNIQVGGYSGGSWSGTTVKDLTGDTYTFADLDTTRVTKSTIEVGSAVSEGQQLALSIKAIDASAAPERLFVRIKIKRS